MKKELAPVVLFVYNRVRHTSQTLEYLVRNELASETVLYVFADGAKNDLDLAKVNEVRALLKSIKGFKEIHIFESTVNKGLANSVIQGVSQVFEKHEKLIVLEDDLITSEDFLKYMNEGLDFFKDRKDIFSVTGFRPPFHLSDTYPYDLFLAYRFSSWGWGSWSDRWSKIDWQMSYFNTFIRSNRNIKTFNRVGNDATAMLLNQMNKKVDSWAIRFSYGCYKHDAFTVYPVYPKVHNIGNDGSGTHSMSSNKFDAQLSDHPVRFINVEPNTEIINQFKKYFSKSLLRRIINILKIYRYKIKLLF